MPPFHPIDSPPLPLSRRRREEINPVFPCGVCERPRVNLYAFACQPDTTVICQRGTLHGCGYCGDAWIDIDVNDAGLVPDPLTQASPTILSAAAE